MLRAPSQTTAKATSLRGIRAWQSTPVHRPSTVVARSNGQVWLQSAEVPIGRARGMEVDKGAEKGGAPAKGARKAIAFYSPSPLTTTGPSHAAMSAVRAAVPLARRMAVASRPQTLRAGGTGPAGPGGEAGQGAGNVRVATLGCLRLPVVPWAAELATVSRAAAESASDGGVCEGGCVPACRDWSCLVGGE